MHVYRYKAVAMAAGSGTATRAAMHSHDISILATEKDILLQLPCNWIIEGVYANLYIKAWCSNLYIQTVHIPEYYAGIACMYMGPVYILKLLISLHAN